MLRGQASIETLAGYGWMIVSIMILFAGLTYFGIIPVRALLPDTCTSADRSFFCRDTATVAGPTSVVLPLSNFAEQRIKVFDGSDPTFAPKGQICTYDKHMTLQYKNEEKINDIPTGGISIGPKYEFNLITTITNKPTGPSCDLGFTYQNEDSGLYHIAKVTFTNPLQS